jgi:hypothetical protein
MNHPAKTKWMAPPAALAALRYRLALVSVAAALGLDHAFLHFHLPHPFTAFAPAAIAITFWYDGITPGILAAVLLSLVRTYLFEPDANALSRFLCDLAFLLSLPLMTQHRHA